MKVGDLVQHWWGSNIPLLVTNMEGHSDETTSIITVMKANGSFIKIPVTQLQVVETSLNLGK